MLQSLQTFNTPVFRKLKKKQHMTTNQSRNHKSMLQHEPKTNQSQPDQQDQQDWQDESTTHSQNETNSQ